MSTEEDVYEYACQALLKDTLKSPASLEIDLMYSSRGESLNKVTIEYSAANSFGALLPGTFECDFMEAEKEEHDPERPGEWPLYLRGMNALSLLSEVRSDREVIGTICPERAAGCSDVELDPFASIGLIGLTSRVDLKLLSEGRAERARDAP